MRTITAAVSMTYILAIMLAVPSHAACIVEEQIWKVKSAAIHRAGELARQQLPILQGLGQINNKAKDAARPIGPQLSTPDLARFSELRQRMVAIQLQQLLEFWLWPRH